MSFINDKTKEINCKIVYYGPAMSGKTTSLNYIYHTVNKGAKGEMISLSQDDDRTLYFDFVPMSIGKIKDYTVRLHLYTVPGEVGYAQSRSLISKGLDGIVFIADSQLEKMEANLKSVESLKNVLKSDGHEWGDLPIIFQYNKRDLGNTVPAAELRELINKEGSPDFETVATKGQGVFEAFEAATKCVLRELKKK